MSPRIAKLNVCVSVCVLQSERTLLFDAMKTELLEKIRRLEEDRQNIDLTSGISNWVFFQCYPSKKSDISAVFSASRMER